MMLVKGEGLSVLRIFVCEDNKEQRERISKIIKDIILIEDFDMELTLITEKPDDVISYIKENDGVGLYFLDIDLKSSINGIKLATKIREYDLRGFIVFITTHTEMSYLTFMYRLRQWIIE